VVKEPDAAGRPLLYTGEHRAPTPLWMVALGFAGLFALCYGILALG
jgi:hypothetical protein